MRNSKIIYSINVEDVKQVAEELLDRKLDKNELEIIEREIVNYIDWYGAIENSINKLQENFSNE